MKRHGLNYSTWAGIVGGACMGSGGDWVSPESLPATGPSAASSACGGDCTTGTSPAVVFGSSPAPDTPTTSLTKLPASTMPPGPAHRRHQATSCLRRARNSSCPSTEHARVWRTHRLLVFPPPNHTLFGEQSASGRLQRGPQIHVHKECCTYHPRSAPRNGICHGPSTGSALTPSPAPHCRADSL